MSAHAILADVQKNWVLYASMPVIAAAIGYVTKLVAIRMMFEPLEFVGRPPWLGWQGVVPANAARMAGIACDLMTARLIDPQEIFRRLDPARIAREIEKPLLEAVDDITREVAAQFQPGLWESMPEAIRKAIIRRIQADAPILIQAIMADLTSNIDRVFDLKEMVVTNLVRDKHLLNRLIQQAGEKEFRFIARSGAVFGFAIGCIQALAWALTHSTWIMPVFGLFTGWFTDWLALKMIFEPKEPVRYLGVLEWQGLFIKRREEVGAQYGALIAQEILTPRNIMDAILRGPLSDRLFAMVQKQVRRVVDEQAGLAKPLVVFAVGTARYQEMKEVVARKVMDRLPDTMRHIEKYAADAMDIRNTLVAKMQ
ncbi:MAG TPA: DUF445 domain-containing protein, partial [Candidatus Binatia bacterium]|nr:DUF445 domain-containing protein [Candidatus Binatia bacterium]